MIRLTIAGKGEIVFQNDSDCIRTTFAYTRTESRLGVQQSRDRLKAFFQSEHPELEYLGQQADTFVGLTGGIETIVEFHVWKPRENEWLIILG